MPSLIQTVPELNGLPDRGGGDHIKRTADHGRIADLIVGTGVIRRSNALRYRFRVCSSAFGPGGWARTTPPENQEPAEDVPRAPCALPLQTDDTSSHGRDKFRAAHHRRCRLQAELLMHQPGVQAFISSSSSCLPDSAMRPSRRTRMRSACRTVLRRWAMIRQVRCCMSGVERVLDQRFALGVEGAGGFVEDEDARVLEQAPGDGKPLPLPAGEVDAALAEHACRSLRGGR